MEFEVYRGKHLHVSQSRKCASLEKSYNYIIMCTVGVENRARWLTSILFLFIQDLSIVKEIKTASLDVLSHL